MLGAGRSSTWQVVREDAKRFKPEALHVPPVGAIPWNPRPAPPTGVKSVLKYPGKR